MFHSLSIYPTSHRTLSVSEQSLFSFSRTAPLSIRITSSNLWWPYRPSSFLPPKPVLLLPPQLLSASSPPFPSLPSPSLFLISVSLPFPFPSYSDRHRWSLLRWYQRPPVDEEWRQSGALRPTGQKSHCWTTGTLHYTSMTHCSEWTVFLTYFQAVKCFHTLHTHTIQVPRVKYVIWNKDYTMVALISKHQLVLATKQLDQLCTVTETYVLTTILCTHYSGYILLSHHLHAEAFTRFLSFSVLF